MKAQLRGRIRRNVATLLELGADVTVLTVRSNKDFFVGLEHPRLRAEFFEARSLYVRVSQYSSRRRRHQIEQADGASDKHEPWVGRGVRTTKAIVGAVISAPVRLVAGGGLVLVHALFPTGAIGEMVRREWRRLPVPIRRAGWRAARWHLRNRRRARATWANRLSPGLVSLGGRPIPVPSTNGRWLLHGRSVLRRQQAVATAALEWRRAISRAAVEKTKDLLRPWHRISRFFAFWRESAERATELAPDLIVSSDLPGLVGAGRGARRLGVPHLHDCHELYLESTSFRPSERHLLAPLERRYMRRADSVVAVNSSIAGEYARRYGREPVVVRNCAPRLTADLGEQDLRTLCGLPASARVVLYQGGFSVGRGLDVCVRAVTGLPEDVHLVLLGFGPLHDELVSLAQTHGVARRVHVLGAVPPEELASWTVSATVGLMPYQPVSRNNFWALPNKIFEYTAVGVPIVVSDLPELRHIALGAGCGEVYDPFDAASLTAALVKVLDAEDYPRYRKAAQIFGRVNVWENEREILVSEMLRVSPHLTKSSVSPGGRLQRAG